MKFTINNYTTIMIVKSAGYNKISKPIDKESLPPNSPKLRSPSFRTYFSIPEAKPKAKLLISLFFAVGILSCDENKHENPSAKSNVGESNRNGDNSSRYGENRGEKSNGQATKSADSALQSQTYDESLASMNDAAISSVLKDLLSRSTLALNSEESDEVIAGIKQLLLRKSPEFYEILELLPPGYFSEKIVNQVFLEANLEWKEFLSVLEKINNPDLSKAAINGAISRLLVSGKEDLKIGIADLENLKGQGLSDQNFSAVLAAGYKSGGFTLEEVARNISESNNFIINSMRRNLSPDQLKDLTLLAYENGRKIDKTSLTMMGRGFAQGDGAAAMSWAQKLPKDAGNIAANAIFDEWMNASPLAASTFLAGMDEGSLKDTSTMALVRNCIKNNGFEDAKLWAAQIGDKKIQAKAFEIIQKAQPPNKK